MKPRCFNQPWSKSVNSLPFMLIESKNLHLLSSSSIKAYATSKGGQGTYIEQRRVNFNQMVSHWLLYRAHKTIECIKFVGTLHISSTAWPGFRKWFNNTQMIFNWSITSSKWLQDIIHVGFHFTLMPTEASKIMEKVTARFLSSIQRQGMLCMKEM